MGIEIIGPGGERKKFEGLSEEEKLLTQIRSNLNKLNQRMYTLYEIETELRREGLSVPFRELEILRKYLVKFDKLLTGVVDTKDSKYVAEWEALKKYPNTPKRDELIRRIKNAIHYYRRIFNIVDKEDTQILAVLRKLVLEDLDAKKARDLQGLEAGITARLKGSLKTIGIILVELRRDILALESIQE